MYTNLLPGDPAPWFRQRSLANPSYAFDSAAGRYLLLAFFGSASTGWAQRAIAAVQSRPDLFNDDRVSFFGVSTDPTDETARRFAERYPGYRYFLDFDGTVSTLYGARSRDAGVTAHRPIWVLVDPTLRVRAVVAMGEDGGELAAILQTLDALPPPEAASGTVLQAPILMLPDVFDKAFCDHLIAYYHETGGTESGFMREENGKTVPKHDAAHKRRKDCIIEDEKIRAHARALILRRIVPEIAKAHQFRVTRMERYIVGCYSAEDGGHFRAHRDNTTKGTAHRRFAVSINLNDDFEGGEVGFPEYGQRRFKARAGGAVIFSCSLLHSVSQVTSGTRFAFLPFLYDDAAAAIRDANQKFLTGGADHKADATPDTGQSGNARERPWTRPADALNLE